MAKKALITAINDYPGTVNDLPSCLEDAARIELIIRADPYGFSDIRTLHDAQMTTQALHDGLTWLFKDAQQNDELLFFYSGHGYSAPKNDTMVQYIVCYDQLFQDERLASLTQNLPQGVLTVVLDSCFSGGMDKPFYDVVEAATVERAKVKFWRPPDDRFAKDVEAEKYVKKYKPFAGPVFATTPPTSPKEFVALAQTEKGNQISMNGLLIAACSEAETAAASTSATGGMSAFTCCFTQALCDSTSNKTVRDAVAGATTRLRTFGFRQTPAVKAPPIPADWPMNPFLGVTPKGTEPQRTNPEPSNGVPDLIRIIAAVIQQLKSVRDSDRLSSIFDKPFLGKSTLMSRYAKSVTDDKNWIDDAAKLVPIVIQVIGALSKDQQKLGLSFGGGASTPLGGGQFGFTMTDKNWIDDAAKLVPVVLQVIGALSKDQQKFGLSFGGGANTPLGGGQLGFSVTDKSWVDDAARIVPLVLTVVDALNNGGGKSLSATTDKNWLEDVANVARIVVPIVVALA